MLSVEKDRLLWQQSRKFYSSEFFSKKLLPSVYYRSNWSWNTYDQVQVSDWCYKYSVVHFLAYFPPDLSLSFEYLCQRWKIKIKNIIVIFDKFKKERYYDKTVDTCMSVSITFFLLIQQGTKVWNPYHRWEWKQTGWINKSSSAGNYSGGYITDSYGCSWHG